MKYAIKINWENGTETFMCSFSEYIENYGNNQILKFNSFEDAEKMAIDLALKQYSIVEIVGD